MTSKHFRTMFVFLATIAIAAGLTAMFKPVRTVSQTSSTGANLQAKVDRHLMLMGEFGNEETLQPSLRDLAAAGPAAVRVTQDTYHRWGTTDSNNLKLGVRPAEMRWRAIHLLGSLGSPEAVPFLYELGRKTLPDPRKGEIKYADEYRITLRAIVGLEQLKAVEELKALHELGGVLANPTAASLFVLGHNVGGVKRVDVKKALAEDTPDYRDHKQSKGRPPQLQKPGKEGIKPTRRPDTPFTSRQSRGD
jgi:hypothetical protein